MGLMSAVRLVETAKCGADEIRLSRVSVERKARIEAALPGAELLTDNAAAVHGADLVIVAVKPKHFKEASAGLRGHIGQDALVVSVMTAIDLSTLSRVLGVANVARASTNIGIEAGLATTYWMAGSEASPEARDLAGSVFDVWGDRIECSREPLLDVGMVGVGSGPALVLEFARAMTGGMEANGMPPGLAEQGIMSLLRGTAELVRGSERSPVDFQRSVVTPGGITAEALKAMEEGKFRNIVASAFQRALDKTAQLSEPKKD